MLRHAVVQQSRPAKGTSERSRFQPSDCPRLHHAFPCSNSVLLPNHLFVPHNVSFMESLSRRHSTVPPCREFEQDALCKRSNFLRVCSRSNVAQNGVTPTAPRACLVTQKSRITNHAWPDCRACRNSRVVTILRLISKCSQFFAFVRSARSPKPLLGCVAVYFPPPRCQASSPSHSPPPP